MRLPSPTPMRPSKLSRITQAVATLNNAASGPWSAVPRAPSACHKSRGIGQVSEPVAELTTLLPMAPRLGTRRYICRGSPRCFLASHTATSGMVCCWSRLAYIVHCDGRATSMRLHWSCPAKAAWRSHARSIHTVRLLRLHDSPTDTRPRRSIKTRFRKTRLMTIGWRLAVKPSCCFTTH